MYAHMPEPSYKVLTHICIIYTASYASDIVYTISTRYGQNMALGDMSVQALRTHLNIRTLYKDLVWPHVKAVSKTHVSGNWKNSLHCQLSLCALVPRYLWVTLCLNNCFLSNFQFTNGAFLERGEYRQCSLLCWMHALQYCLYHVPGIQSPPVHLPYLSKSWLTMGDGCTPNPRHSKTRRHSCSPFSHYVCHFYYKSISIQVIIGRGDIECF